MTFTVLYVCTANVSRSPYLALRSAQLMPSYAGQPALEGAVGPVFGGAGTHGIEGEPIDPQMARLLIERGVEPSQHRSRALTPALISAADLVLTATADHRRRILADEASAVRKTFTLGQFVANVGELADELTGAALVADRRAVQALRRPGGADLDDPYGRSPDTARRVADEMDELLRVILPRLA